MIQISGTVVDMATGQGIPSATLSVNNQPVGAAGAGGNFTLNLASYNDTITASSVGYHAASAAGYEVQEAGDIQLSQDPDALEAAVVTAPPKTPTSIKLQEGLWWGIAGLAIITSLSDKRPFRKGTGHQVGATKGSNLVPVALLGLGAYLLLKPKAPVYSPYPGTTTSPYPTPAIPGNAGIFSPGGILSPGNITSIVDVFKNLFSSSSASENTPSGTYSSYDPTARPGGGDSYAGIGATTTINAGDIIGHTLVAAMKVPLYDQARDDAQPSGYVNAGNPIGIVSSYLNPDTSKGRAELWWMFEPLPGNSDIGDSQGFYYVPHNPDYFDTKALTDSGVLTVAQATALKQGAVTSTAEKLLDKYVPWLIGGIVAIGVAKAVINKAV